MYIDKDGTPRSRQFDDVYFSSHGGFEETQYVYIDGNRLPERFAALQPAQTLSIAELGFGTGLNCLATILQWKKLAPSDTCLYYHAIEGFPLSKDELRQALIPFANLALEIDNLLCAYPTTPADKHVLELTAGVTVILYCMMVDEAITHIPSGIDAWYLDGFAPAKNSDMWTQQIFEHMYQASNPGATLATFTAAGMVRRGLSIAGFDVQRRPGFAHKREHLVGIKQTTEITHAPAA